jgi:hypothetical protein
VVDDTATAEDPELTRMLEAVPSDAERIAKDRNAAGLRRHQRGDLAGAVRDYESALEAWAGHVLARYNLACAFSLLGRRDEALIELGRLAKLDRAGADIQDSLEKARVDADFAALRGDPTFRDLTGFTSIVVVWPAGDIDAETRARAAVEALKGARWEARLEAADPDDPATLSASAGDPAKPVLIVAEDDATAQRSAVAVSHAVRGRGTTLRRGGAGIRVVFLSTSHATTADTDAPAAPVDAGPNDDVPLSDWMGPRLTARDGERTHQLQLKATGFFEWRIAEASGRTSTRLGRYRASDTGLVFEYRETIETPVADGAQPTLETHDQRSAAHPVRTTRQWLELDGLRFAR